MKTSNGDEELITNKFLGFPKQYHQIHQDVGLNYQLNRMYGWVGEERMLKEMYDVAPKIHDYEDWKREFLRLGEEAIAQGRTLVGGYYLRTAEFFMFSDDPDKLKCRSRFMELALAANGMSIKDRLLIPYENGYLPAYRFTPANSKGTIVIFGGYDSYMEEWFPMLDYLKDNGYDIVSFEGPGQGGALEEFHLKMTPDWHKPVGTVLDYFGLEDVTLIGISLGGCLVMRAAAFEKRVKRVVADDVMTNFLEVILRHTKGIVSHLPLEKISEFVPGIVDSLFNNKAKDDKMVEWGVKQGLHVMGVSSPHAWLQALNKYRTDNISDKVDQDVLLMCAAEDHFAPVTQLPEQVGLLTNARSIATRFFTHHEQAQNHCQTGNMKLSLKVIVAWLKTFEE